MVGITSILGNRRRTVTDLLAKQDRVTALCARVEKMTVRAANPVPPENPQSKLYRETEAKYSEAVRKGLAVAESAALANVSEADGEKAKARRKDAATAFLLLLMGIGVGSFLRAWIKLARHLGVPGYESLSTADGDLPQKEVAGDVREAPETERDELGDVAEGYASARGELLKPFVNDVQEAMRLAVESGKAAGENVHQIGRRLAEVAKEIGEGRGAVVAATEALTAFGYANLRAMQAAGYTHAEWIQLDRPTKREKHAVNMSMGEQPIGTLYPNGQRFPGDPAGGPGECINCLCWLKPTRKEPLKASDQVLAVHVKDYEKHSKTGKVFEVHEHWDKRVKREQPIGPKEVGDKAKELAGNVTWEHGEKEKTEQPKESGNKYADRLRMRRTRAQLISDIKLNESWKDWYDRNEAVMDDVFGSDAHVFKKFLAITSQAATVKSNVGLALKALGQWRRGEEFSGFLDAVKGNLDKERDNLKIETPKISAYIAATHGDTESVVVDRHIVKTLFRTPSDKPTRSQIRKATNIIKELADQLGWKPREIQAALWAASIRRSGKEPQSYDDYIRKLQQSGGLESRIGGYVKRGGGNDRGTGDSRPASGEGSKEV